VIGHQLGRTAYGKTGQREGKIEQAPTTEIPIPSDVGVPQRVHNTRVGYRGQQLDDPQSDVSRRIAMDKVTVRKPEKGTKPKLFYAGVEGDLLTPAMMETQSSHFWAMSRT